MTKRKRRSTGKPWVLGEGKYLSVRTASPRSVSSGPAVDTLRAALGLPAGAFDAQVRDLVLQAQADAGRDVTGIVAEADWKAIVNPTPRRARKPSSAPPSGGVDGADEPDDPTGELDPPQGPE
ncbi:MAG: hypothetical protein E6R04_05210 [Spirochaetes bacterium]|nr:MAG: hypothetical protein E6R04_05210 [Spirochaetota bacterium]